MDKDKYIFGARARVVISPDLAHSLRDFHEYESCRKPNCPKCIITLTPQDPVSFSATMTMEVADAWWEKVSEFMGPQEPPAVDLERPDAEWNF